MYKLLLEYRCFLGAKLRMFKLVFVGKETEPKLNGQIYKNDLQN